TVTLILPLAPVGAPSDLAAPPPPPRRPAVTLPPATVVVIEDTPSNVRLLEQVFASLPEIMLYTAPTGMGGLALVQQHQPALIVLDLHLPDVDGDVVVERLKAAPATSQIPIVILSADATPGQRERLLALGASAYLTKPLATDELLQTASHLLRPAG
ncbi:MAG TPA: response regulator, partial [Herpetosiphonaceae bacterium]